MTFAFIERAGGAAVLRAGNRAGGDRESAVGEVRGAAPVAAAGPRRRRARTTGGAGARTSGCSRPAAGSRRRAKAARSALAWCGAAATAHWSAPARAGRLLRREGRGRAARARRSASSALEFAPAATVSWSPGRAAEVSRPTAAALARRRRSAAAGGRGGARVSRRRRGLRRRDRSRRCSPRRSGRRPARASRCRGFRRSCATSRSSSTKPCLLPLFVALSVRRRPRRCVSIVEFDRYQGKGVPEGRVSLSLRLTFRAPGSHADRRRGADGRCQASSTRSTASHVALQHAAGAEQRSGSGHTAPVPGSKRESFVGERAVATRAVDLEPIDRLEEKVKLLVGDDRSAARGSTPRASDENARLGARARRVRGAARDAEGADAEIAVASRGARPDPLARQRHAAADREPEPVAREPSVESSSTT